MEELEIFQVILDELKKVKGQDYFEINLILSAHKIVGLSHIKKMLDHIRISKEKYPNLVVGFDMVNEEDFTPEIAAFASTILGA